MLHFLEEGGWGMYPVLAFGIATLIVAGRQLLHHDPRRNLTALWLMALTLMAGVIGTSIGMQTSARFLHTTTEKWLWFVGLQESLNNLVLASMMIALAILMMLAAHLRSAPPKGRRVSSNDDPTDHDEVTPSGARRRLIAI